MISKKQYRALLAFLPKDGRLIIDGPYTVAFSENANAMAWTYDPGSDTPNEGPYQVVPQPIGQQGPQVHPGHFPRDPEATKGNNWRIVCKRFETLFYAAHACAPGAYNPKQMAQVAAAYKALGVHPRPLMGTGDPKHPGFLAIGDQLYGLVMPYGKPTEATLPRPIRWPE